MRSILSEYEVYLYTSSIFAPGRYFPSDIFVENFQDGPTSGRWSKLLSGGGGLEYLEYRLSFGSMCREYFQHFRV